mgnify:FL=1
MSEELKNNANNEMNDDELENVAGGIGGKGKLHTQILFCPNCHSTNVGKISPRVHRCRDCDHHFTL